MRLKSASGLTLVELIVVVGVLLTLFFAFCPFVTTTYSVGQANMTAVGCRGKDIYVAVTAANVEREAVGLPPLWPRDFDPAVDTNNFQLAELDFESSTAYFKWLLDEPHLGTEQWNPRVADIDYSKLAGAGVPSCYGGQKLSASNNLWTVAKNVRPDMDDIIPILVTRNIDASSLAASVTEQDVDAKSLRFDPVWSAPFGGKAYVLIRKGGGIFKGRRKYMSYGVVYKGQTFDATNTPDGRVVLPLKYLTPTRSVVPCEKVYMEGAAVAYQLAGGGWGPVKRAMAKYGGVCLCFAAVYLIAFLGNVKKCKRLGLKPPTSAPVIAVWVCHCLAVTFFAVGIMLAGDDNDWAGMFMVAVLAVLALGITLALVFQRHDRLTRRQQIKWLLFLFLLIASFLSPAV